MKKEDILNECKIILKEHAAADKKDKVDAIQEQDNIAQTLGLDSLDLVEMVMALEEKFNVSIEEQDIAKIITVNDMVTYIEDKLKGKYEIEPETEHKKDSEK